MDFGNEIMFVIEGKEWNLYKADSDLDDIKNAFINCPTVNYDDKSNYKYIGLTYSNDICSLATLIVTFNNKFIIEESSLRGKCIFPIKVKDLSNMVSELANHYRNLGYEIIARR